MKLILIRHGKTEYNERRAYCGALDPSLSDLGQRELEASEAKRFLREHPPELAFVSPMKRATETADILFAGMAELPRLYPEELREIDFGRFEGKSYEELKDDPEYIAWLDTNCEALIPGGDFPDSFREDVAVGFEQILESCRTERVEYAAIVSHGGVLGTILARYASPQKNWYEWKLPNGAFLVLEGDTHFEVTQMGGGATC